MVHLVCGMITIGNFQKAKVRNILGSDVRSMADHPDTMKVRLLV